MRVLVLLKTWLRETQLLQAAHSLHEGCPFVRSVVDCIWNVIAHAHKPDFVFRRNGRVHLNRQGRQFSRLLAAEFCSSAVVMLDTPRSEVVWRVLATYSIRQFPLHFPSRVPPCAITFHLDTTANSATSTDETKFIFLICEGKYFYG